MGTQIRGGASHPKTNAIIYSLITKHLPGDGLVLDFGAGEGYMSQRIGQFFQEIGMDPRKHVFACEISPHDFKYNDIDCRKISTNSEIPFNDNAFDIIYAIEVLEHMTRPYDFFVEAFKKLKKGGRLIFSAPNILHMQSRLSFLLSGYPQMYGPLSTQDKNSGRLCGHIMPLSYNNFHYGLRKAGFNPIEFYVDRRKKGSLIFSFIMFPILKLISINSKKNCMKYDQEVFSENKDVISIMNSIDMLSARSCILVAQKPLD